MFVYSMCRQKAMLRQLKGHNAAVRATVWTGDGLHFISGADDGRVKQWDLALQEVSWECKEDNHKDYVRCVDAHPTVESVFASGSYDHTARLWDSRQRGHVQDMQHGQPLEACVFSPSGALFFTAGGNEVKVWDVLGGGKLVHTFSNHQKNVTCLSLDSIGSRLLSSGLDGHVKIYSLQTLKVVHGLRFDSPLLSVALAPNNTKLIVGHVDGTISCHTKEIKSNAQSNSTLRQSNGGRYFSSSSRGAGGEGVVVGRVDTHRTSRLNPFEKLLKSFNYQRALDAALKSDNPVIITSLIEELCRRSGLTIALSGRDEIGLQTLLSYAVRNVANPKYTHTIVQTMQRVLDLYGSEIGHTDSVLEACVKLNNQVKQEILFQRQISRLLGSLDAVMSSSSVVRSRHTGGEQGPDSEIVIPEI